MILTLLLSCFAQASSTPQTIDYRSGDKLTRHKIEGQTLEISSGSSKRKRPLTKDDLKWVSEKVAVLRRLQVKDCTGRAIITVHDTAGDFLVCGDQKDAQDFLSVLATK